MKYNESPELPDSWVLGVKFKNYRVLLRLPTNHSLPLTWKSGTFEGCTHLNLSLRRRKKIRVIKRIFGAILEIKVKLRQLQTKRFQARRKSLSLYCKVPHWASRCQKTMNLALRYTLMGSSWFRWFLFQMVGLTLWVKIKDFRVKIRLYGLRRGEEFFFQE